MSESLERVKLHLGAEGFTERMALVKAAAEAVAAEMALAGATWEPHDWSDFR